MQVRTSPADPGNKVDIRPPLSRDDLGDVLKIAMRAGQLMLENGANTVHLAACVPKKSIDEPRPEACDLNL